MFGIISRKVFFIMLLVGACNLAPAEDGARADQELERKTQADASKLRIRWPASLEAERKNVAALRVPITVNWSEKPLDQIVAEFQKVTGIEFAANSSEFLKFGGESNPRYTCDFGEVTVLFILNHLRSRWSHFRITWSLEDGTVVLRPMDIEDDYFFTRVYDISKLTRWLKENGVDRETELDSKLLDHPIGRLGVADRFRLTTVTIPQSRGQLLRRSQAEAGYVETLIAGVILRESGGHWIVIEGEGGSIHYTSDRLFVHNTYSTHLEVAGVLDSLEQLMIGEGSERPTPFQAWDDPGTEEAALQMALDTKISVRFEKSPLDNVLKQLGKTRGFRYQIDPDEFDPSESSPQVTLELNDVKLRTALHLILEPLELVSIPHEGMLVIRNAGHDCGSILQGIGYRVDRIPLAADRGALTELILGQTSGKWMDRDREGGTMVWLGPKILLINTGQRQHAEIATLLRELEKQLPSNAAALVKPANAPVPLMEVRLYKFGSEKEAKEIRRAIPLLVDERCAVQTVRKVGTQLVIEASPSGHKQIDKFLQMWHDKEIPIEKTNGRGFGVFNVPEETPR